VALTTKSDQHPNRQAPTLSASLKKPGKAPAPSADPELQRRAPALSAIPAPIRRAPALSAVTAPARRAPALSGQLAPTRRAPALSAVMAPAQGAPALSGDLAPLRQAPALSTIMKPSRRAPARPGNLAPCRRADAPFDTSPRRKTDAPSYPSVSLCRSDAPPTPPQTPRQSNHRVAFGPDPPRVATPSSVAVDPSSPNPRLLQATQRNLARVDEANLTDTVTIGKSGYLTAGPAFYFAALVKGPDDSFGAPDWFLNKLRTIASATVPIPKKATIRFEVSANAADYNADLL
jgi:hypothetical protein